jgi:GNAT superfamily N-acetyltransferase
VEEWARTASPSDVERIAELERLAGADVAEQKGGPLRLLRDARRFDASLLGTADVLVVVGGLDDIVFGYAVVRAETLADASVLAVVDALYVEPLARDLAVGEVMMDAVLAWSVARRCRGIDAIALPGDRATKNFFERFGLTARAIVVHRALP